MPTKTQRIYELLQDTSKSLSDYRQWRAFLNTAAWQYKYSFNDQMLIYAQRPDATACARIEIWNDTMHRWVNRGAKGIALLREDGNRMGLEYVFDVSDTNSRDGYNVQLWKYDERYKDAVVETLENTFGKLKVTTTIYDAVLCAAHNAVQDNKVDYLRELKYLQRDSLLAGLDNVNLDLRFRQTAEASVAYIILRRMNLQPEDMLDYSEFEHIRDFNTPEVMNILGSAVSVISEDALRSISQTIKAEKRREKFAQQENILYNKSENNIESVNEERNEENGRDSIQNNGRLSDTRIDSPDRGTQYRQIRTDEENVSQRAPQAAVLDTNDEGRAVQSLGGSGQDGNRADRADSSTDGGAGGRDRVDESQRPVEMDRFDAQFSPFSRRNDTSGAGVQLSLFDIVLPSESEQIANIEKAEQAQRSVFSMPQQIIDEVLTSGANSRDTILDICVQYSKGKSSAENTDFLKEHYGVGGKGFIFGQSKVSVWWNTDGMRVAYGDTAIGKDQLLSWEQVESRIKELLDIGRYAPQETLDKLGETERMNVAISFWYMHSNLDKTEFPELRDLFKGEWFANGFPDSTARIAEILKTPEGIAELSDIVKNLAERYKQNPDIMRFKMYAPDKILPMFEDLQLEHKHFTANEYQVGNAGRFITEDEIDKLFQRGSGYEQGKIRIYLYFQEHTDTKERIDFLKSEYGTGGYGGGIFNEWHDAKGITFSRSDIMSPLAKVTIPWNKAEKRIDNLIKSGRYLTEQQLDEDIPRYQSEQEQQKIRQEKYNVLHDMDRLTPEEKRATLARRISIFTDIADNSDKRIFADYGIENLMNETEIGIAEAIRNTETRQKLMDCMQKIGGASTDTIGRNCGYAFAEELRGLKTIDLHKVGDFYEIYGDEAVQAAEVLGITLTRRHTDSGDIPMTGVPVFAVERYAEQLSKNGYIVGLQEEQLAPFYENKIPEYDNIIGRNLVINDHQFIIESVDYTSGDVSMRDVTFENNVGFPINRVEKIGMVERILEEQTAEVKQAEETEQVQTEQSDLTPHLKRPKSARVDNTVIYPEIPMSERHNFRITDDNLGVGGPKEKFRNNIAAIEMLKTLESEHRLATPEEQEILSRYVGWGGLSDAFDETKDNWHTEYNQLKNLLTDTEYTSARESSLTAFYTPPVVIRSIYNALENMGLKNGNILDPAMGVGNFEGMMPDSLSGCKVYGIELDSISGRIAQQLYQKNSVAIQGYENSTLPDSFFDCSFGNIPFGDFKLLDKKYDKHNFLIHDYFFAKTLDKVRPGGVIAFITSSGTMDKKNSNIRKYIAQRADLVGAIRLPNNTFKANAGTEVTSDILFLQKRDRMTDIMPEWVHLGTDENEHTINQYFVDNPDMILGDMVEESGPFGMQLTCKPYEGADLGELLDGAIQNIHAQITEYEFDDISNDEDLSIPADPNVKNFSYTVVDGDVYFRENSRMNKVDLSLTAANRVKGMIEIRDCLKTLIEYQTEDYPDNEIKEQQEKLNKVYDAFTAKYGLINSRGNNMAFSADSSYFLLCSLEVLNDNRELERKSDIFTKRTIGAKKEIKSVDTASEALAVSIGEKARIDMELMSQLTGKTEQELFEDLKGVIFLNPLFNEVNSQNKYLTADEYLSGNVREKLEWAKRSAELYPDDYNVNVEYLEKVQPKDLTASEITVRLGTTWIPPEYIKQFTFELLNPSYYAQRKIDVHYSKLTGNWNVEGKSSDKVNVKINNTYGTKRANALKIIEDTLNLRDVRIFDYVENEKGNRVAVLNHKETTIAQQKQEAIKAAFADWIWKDPTRREKLTRLYNDKFNSIRTREYDGSHIVFSGMNPEIQLRQHQKNAVARIMYGGNSLLGHVVGAGKTWTMAAAAMESKRLGLCNKPMFVVPNHLTEQWASEFLQLYPAANILVTTKKDFETKNRKKFCGRIATGDYDAVIIGHSQFEKIPMSIERQEIILQRQLDEIVDGIAEAKNSHAERFTIKQMGAYKERLGD